MPLRPFLPFFMLLLLGPAHRSAAAEVRVAVAANFAPCLEELAPVFAEASGHRIQPIVGSTGRLVAQITAGAPFDVFLAADSRSCRRLVADGLADGDSRFTYALGSLVLWLATAPATEDRQLARLLNVPTVQRIALANHGWPPTAPQPSRPCKGPAWTPSWAGAPSWEAAWDRPGSSPPAATCRPPSWLFPRSSARTGAGTWWSRLICTSPSGKMRSC
jgi:hypothetical protein